MSFVKVQAKHQITIPKPVVKALQLEVGEKLELAVRNGNGTIILKRVAGKMVRPKLSSKEQQTLKSAKRKIAAIQKDLRHAKGLTKAETDVAAKAGLIDPDQRWWWTEEWQAGEREAERNIAEGRVENFDSAEAFINSLRS